MSIEFAAKIIYIIQLILATYGVWKLDDYLDSIFNHGLVAWMIRGLVLIVLASLTVGVILLSLLTWLGIV